LKGWKHVFLLPPDLLTVLNKRCKTWHQRGTRIGGTGYRESMVVVNWVSEMARPRGRGDKDEHSHDLLEIIEHRHPFNVREQLRDFARCCESVLLHREWLKNKGPRQDSIPWSDKSYEFFVRVFLLGEYRFFSEGLCEYPNIYDNDYVSSPFNACTRSWVVWYFRKNEIVEASELIAFLTEVGIPEDEVASAIDSLKRYRLLLPLPPKDNRLVLSIWGDYFRSAIAYDLPYIATVWWATNMLEDYALGEAREPLASELREYAAKFLRWLDCEEKMAFRQVRKHGERLHKVYDDTSYNVSYSLRRIEHALGE
jgi:hypothetical protein